MSVSKISNGVKQVFLDFDDVIFNTRDFLTHLQSVFQEFGVSKELFETTYQALKAASTGKDFCYSFLAHIDQVKTRMAVDEVALCAKLNALLADTSSFVFPDVSPFLQFLKNKGYTIAILSFGDSDYQSRKIAGAGLASEVTKVLVTQEDKQRALAQEALDPLQETWFFDDRVHFLESVKQGLPFVKTVLVRRPEGRFHEAGNEFCEYAITDFSEAEPFFKD